MALIEEDSDWLTAGRSTTLRCSSPFEELKLIEFCITSNDVITANYIIEVKVATLLKWTKHQMKKVKE